MTNHILSTDHIDDLDAFIPLRIRELRHFMGFSAVDLDRTAGFIVGTTGRMERRLQRVYASHLYSICQATDVAIDFFYRASDGIALHNFTNEHEKFRLLDAYHRIENPIARRDIFELIESIANESDQQQT